jgi:transglutaminase-like putative cysteine protease
MGGVAVNDTERLPETRLLLALQIVCAASAVASLPRGEIHPVWLATFIVPSALFLLLGSGRIGHIVPIWARFVVAALVQVGFAFATFRLFGELREKDALACSLLPALTYFTLRREPSDTSLSLFLSFCFLLIGIMLNRERSDWTLLVFLCSCAWAMQIEASNRVLAMRHAARGVAMSLVSRLLRRTQVIAALMLVAFLVYHGIDLIPSPVRSSPRQEASQPSSHSGRIMGLNSRFDLSGSNGSPLNLTADRVIRVVDPTGKSVPRDLYLRMTYFDRAFADEWQTWPPSWQNNEVSRSRFDVREPILPLSRYPRYRIDVERLEPAANGEMFLPPGTEQIRGIRRMVFERNVGYFRSEDPIENGYGVLYQRPHKKRRLMQDLDSFHDQFHFKELPAELRTRELIQLARELGGPGAKKRPPMDLARKISGGLQDRCAYVLREPTGGYDDAIHNFLFGNRKGYCMHFATSLAILLRIHDVPCRIAVGFHAGDDAGEGDREFGSQHAHAWVEVPLQNLGWTVIDPTPPADRTRRGWPDPNKPEEAAPKGAESGGGPFASTCFLAGLSDPLANPGAFMVLTFVFICLTFGILLLALRRTDSTARRSSPRPTPDSIRARRLLDQILAGLAKCGMPKRHRATLEQYLGALDAEADVDVPVFADAFQAYQDVRFGAKHLDDEREDRLTMAVAAAKDTTS